MRAWHRSIIFYFAFAGVAWASWVVRLPEVKKLTNVSTAQLGIILLMGAIGALVALTSSNRMIERFGTKASLIAGYSLFTVTLVSAGFSASLHSAVAVGVFSFFIGFGVGFADVAQNVDGAQLEQITKKSLMPRLHASYSLGTVIGAAYGSLGSWLHFAIQWQTWVMAPLFAALVFFSYRHIPSGTGRLVPESRASAGEANAVVDSASAISFEADGASGSVSASSLEAGGADFSAPRRQSGFKVLFGTSLILLGLGIFSVTLVEGASNDWLALALVENYRVTPANAGVGYAFLVASMTVTRFFGGSLVDRWGRDVVIRRAALVGIAGIIAIIFAPAWFGDAAVYVAWVAAALWGSGVALAFPLFLSAAGEGKDSARRVALVATCGYTAFLVGPPLLGFLGQTIGLLAMFWVLTACLAVAVFLAKALRTTAS